jgi:peptidoglycan/LPS O-acetylase OafA/YrhL
LNQNWGTTFTFILGRIGVVIFFLLSGYLAVEARDKRSCGQYIFNRLIRMYPIYWVLLLLTFLSRNFLHTGEPISVVRLLANMTLFHEFMGMGGVLGASWMMPMQVCFFVIVGFFGNKLLTYKIKNKNIDIKTIIIATMMLLSIITGAVRYVSRLPFPTAFFLLIAVAFLGADFKHDICSVGSIAQCPIIIIRVLLFEVGLLISTRLSYGDQFVAYIFAYNIGIILFLVAFYTKPSLCLLNKFSTLGFTFFLGAGIPFEILSVFIDFSQSLLMRIIGWVLKFIMALIFAWIMTICIEKPLQTWARKIEKKIR